MAIRNNFLITDHQSININERQRALDILGHPPGWMIQWGITLFFIIISIFLGLSFFISYPDSLDAPVTIRTELPPLPLVTKIGGAIDSILVANNNVIHKGEVIAITGTTVDYAHMIRIKEALQSLSEQTLLENEVLFSFSDIIHLGPINEEYLSFLNAYTTYISIRKTQKPNATIQSSKNEISQIRKLNGLVENEISLYDKEMGYVEKNIERGNDLHSEGLLSDAELEKLLKQSANTKRQLSSLRSSITRNDLKENQLQWGIRKTQIDYNDELRRAWNQLDAQVRRLQSSIHLWEEEHLIKAPGTGIISFAQDWRPNQQLIPMETFGMIVPSESKNTILAYCNLPLKGIGKIKKGDKVQISIDAFPYQQFGQLSTLINEIPLIPYENKSAELVYEVIFPLGDTMITNYNIQLPFKQDLTGVATIITENRSVFQRIFNQLTSAIMN